MYSILKIFVHLKLTFILIIFSLGGICILDRVVESNRPPVADPMSYAQGVKDPSGKPGIQEPESVLPVKKIPSPDAGESPDPGPSGLKPCCLGDLKLRIEF